MCGFLVFPEVYMGIVLVQNIVSDLVIRFVTIDCT
jgi:hypothetical protein